MTELVNNIQPNVVNNNIGDNNNIDNNNNVNNNNVNNEIQEEPIQPNPDPVLANNVKKGSPLGPFLKGLARGLLFFATAPISVPIFATATAGFAIYKLVGAVRQLPQAWNTLKLYANGLPNHQQEVELQNINHLEDNQNNHNPLLEDDNHPMQPLHVDNLINNHQNNQPNPVPPQVDEDDVLYNNGEIFEPHELQNDEVDEQINNNNLIEELN
ncbi:MAG: hypothetical protein K6F05_04335 [Succinivibrio sp.]|nr:hypothetical protein [Succinivibrio sp.]